MIQEDPMKLPRRYFLHLAVGAAALPAMSHFALAETYPARPITLVVPFAAGGGIDVLARILGERLRMSLGQPVVVENIAGAGGSIGVGRAARAAGDGYVLVLGGLYTHVINSAIYNLQYDTVTDFEPVALVSMLPLLIVARKTMPADDLKGLINWIKANPDKASTATAGAGTPQHIAGVYFQNMTGARFQFVPYRAGLLQGLLAEQVDFVIDVADQSLALVRAGRIKVYGVTANRRMDVAPDIPTVDEAGLPGFHISVWRAIWAAKGTPKAIVSKLNAAIVEALEDPITRSRITSTGQAIPRREEQAPEALSALQKAEIQKWWPIIKAAGIKGE
jgi:tripartite-type tricarboxylate transporter receptor subunit TctC